MQVSFRSFGLGLILATVLVYLILVAQFKSFLDPLVILLAVPTGLTGVLLILFATGTTLNVMSLMGVVMMVGIVVSNSILIVEFTRRLPGALASGADDFARHADGLDSDGLETWHRQRSLCAAGPRHYRRSRGFSCADCVHRPDSIFYPLPAEGIRRNESPRRSERNLVPIFPPETNHFGPVPLRSFCLQKSGGRQRGFINPPVVTNPQAGRRGGDPIIPGHPATVNARYPGRVGIAGVRHWPTRPFCLCGRRSDYRSSSLRMDFSSRRRFAVTSG